MSFRATSLSYAIAAAAATGILGGCAHSPVESEALTLTGVAEVVPKPVGCGHLFIGTPVTFRVVSGPRSLRGKRIRAAVACLNFYPDFYVVGRSYELQLTRQNVYKIEIQLTWQDGYTFENAPDHLAEPLSFYLKAATNLETGKTNAFDKGEH